MELLIASKTVETVILGLPSIRDFHAPSHPTYALIQTIVRNEVESRFCEATLDAKSFEPFGEIVFPYFEMGAINSVNLFALDELIIFSFYWANRKVYKNVLDIGGNLGLHSIVMSRCGFDVKTYEPDLTHFEKLQENLTANRCENVQPIQAAVSNESGTATFVRVLGNTTSSHLAGSKDPYGELEHFDVPVVDIKEIIAGIDFMKMDAEGHEKPIILGMDRSDWEQLDAIVEIGSLENAQAVFEHLSALGVDMFAQKGSWNRVKTLDQMPTSHRDGSLFITCKGKMNWGTNEAF